MPQPNKIRNRFVAGEFNVETQYFSNELKTSFVAGEFIVESLSFYNAFKNSFVAYEFTLCKRLFLHWTVCGERQALHGV